MLKPFLLTLEYPPQIGGVAKYLEGEVKNFAGDVVVARAQTMMWPSATRSHPQPRTCGAEGGGGWLPLVWRARPDYKKQSCDGLWISHVLPIGYVALVWKWLFKTPYRIYVHGLDLVRPQQSPWKKFWVKRILLAADEIVANSNATAQLLSNYGVAPARARVQYPRINPPLPRGPQKLTSEARNFWGGVEGGEGGWERTARFLRRQHNINDKPLLLTISRLVKRKGIDLVLRALPAIWKTIPDLVYVIAGEGEERKNLDVIASEALAERSNPDAKAINFGIAEPVPSDSEGARSASPRNDIGIIFTGSVSDEEKYGWLAACDCFILTPINDPNDFEGYGIVYKEAQMFGKPVIGSRVGGVPEAVGDNGILVEPGNVQEIAKAILLSLRPRAERGGSNPDAVAINSGIAEPVPSASEGSSR